MTPVAEILPLGVLMASLPLLIAALMGLRAGMWIRERVDASTYRGWLHGLLWLLCGLLVVQFIRDL